MLVTGATGFLGRFVVASAVARTHRVRVLVRPGSDIAVLGSAVDTALVDVHQGDVLDPASLSSIVAGVDVVVHLAAAKDGAFADRFANTVVGTENVLAAMSAGGVRHLVAASTLSIYDYGLIRSGARLDESAPTIRDATSRDPYAETKLYQEELENEFNTVSGNRVVYLRPGMIIGPGCLWHPLLGGDLGPLAIRVGGRRRAPTVYVEHAASAFVLAAERLISRDHGPMLDGEVINLVDDDLPTCDEYVHALRRRIPTEAPTLVPKIPYRAMRTIGQIARIVDQRFADGKARFPGLLVPEQVEVRFKSLRYSNEKAKQLLGWQPTYSWEQAIDRCSGAIDLVADVVGCGGHR